MGTTQYAIHIPSAAELQAINAKSQLIQQQQLTKLSMQVMAAVPIPGVKKVWAGIAIVANKVLAPIQKFIQNGIDNLLKDTPLKSQTQRIADQDAQNYEIGKDLPYFFVGFYDADFTQIARYFDNYNIFMGTMTADQFNSGHFTMSVMGDNVDISFNAPNGFSTQPTTCALSSHPIYFLFPNVLSKYIEQMAYQNQVNEANLLAATYLTPSQIDQFYASIGQQGGMENFITQYQSLNSDQKTQYFAQLASTLPSTSDIPSILSTLSNKLGTLTQQQWIYIGIGATAVVLILIVLD